MNPRQQRSKRSYKWCVQASDLPMSDRERLGAFVTCANEMLMGNKIGKCNVAEAHSLREPSSPNSREVMGQSV